MFSDENEISPSSVKEEKEEDMKMFDGEIDQSKNETNEPEMFKDSEVNEDFEIPAFLRRQKN